MRENARAGRERDHLMHDTREDLETRKLVVTSGNMGHYKGHNCAVKNMADDNLEFDLTILEAFSCVNFSDHQLLTLI